MTDKKDRTLLYWCLFPHDLPCGGFGQIQHSAESGNTEYCCNTWKGKGMATHVPWWDESKECIVVQNMKYVFHAVIRFMNKKENDGL